MKRLAALTALLLCACEAKAPVPAGADQGAMAAAERKAVLDTEAALAESRRAGANAAADTAAAK